MGKKDTRDKWKKERNTVKAIQVAFDVGDQIQYQIRKEALDMAITPSDRIRQILGLPVNAKRIRPRLSISLSDEDFALLSKKTGIPLSDKVQIKREAAGMLAEYVNDQTGKKKKKK